MKEAYIVSAVRTPMGSFGGSLAGMTATQLGSIAIQGALGKIGLDPNEVQEVYMGNVISANLGQAPARQAALGAGLSKSTPCTTVNKVCASGMKSIMLAATSVMAGQNEVVIAGGMESMSNIPFYLDKARFGYKLGNGQLTDGLLKDGLWDVYNNFHMGNAGELCAREDKISREDQDAYAIGSYTKAANAWKNGKFQNEIVPVPIPQRKGDPVLFAEDEEYKNVNFDKIPSLNPVFDKAGTITAANASTLNDGASAVIIMSKEKAEALGIKPLAKIIGFADAATEPEWFTIAPSLAIPIALKRAGIEKEQVDFYELNEAFAVVALANNRRLGLNPDKVNVYGGGVSLGHPLGSSGARITITLLNVLQQEGGKYGVASLCNGGGGASAIVIEKV